MEKTLSKPPSATAKDLQAWCDAINSSLKPYSDKDWNYSRISLELRKLDEIDAPYALAVEWIDTRNKKGQKDFHEMTGEITWGQRHSAELGILELISLRLNHALNTVTSADYWHGIRPVVRLQKKEEFIQLLQTHAFWYQIKEVQGDKFENR